MPSLGAEPRRARSQEQGKHRRGDPHQSHDVEAVVVGLRGILAVSPRQIGSRPVAPCSVASTRCRPARRTARAGSSARPRRRCRWTAPDMKVPTTSTDSGPTRPRSGDQPDSSAEPDSGLSDTMPPPCSAHCRCRSCRRYLSSSRSPWYSCSRRSGFVSFTSRRRRPMSRSRRRPLRLRRRPVREHPPAQRDQVDEAAAPDVRDGADLGEEPAFMTKSTRQRWIRCGG